MSDWLSPNPPDIADTLAVRNQADLKNGKEIGKHASVKSSPKRAHYTSKLHSKKTGFQFD